MKCELIEYTNSETQNCDLTPGRKWGLERVRCGRRSKQTAYCKQICLTDEVIISVNCLFCI